MIVKTDKKRAPWKVIAGDSKPYARVAVLEHVCHVIETGLTKRGYNIHDAD
jgi:polyphosphate kinase 2 (PPK2 family)